MLQDLIYKVADQLATRLRSDIVLKCGEGEKVPEFIQGGIPLGGGKHTREKSKDDVLWVSKW